MNTLLRTSLSFATAAGLSIVAACRESQPTADILAQDSALAAEVLAANQDTISLADADTLSIEPVTAPIAVPAPSETPISEAPIRVLRAEMRNRAAASVPVSISSSSTKRVTPRRARRSTQTASARSARQSTLSDVTGFPRRKTVSTARKSTTLSREPVRSEQETNRSAPPVFGSRMRATATIPAGSDLVFAASEKVCTAGGIVGDRFIAEVAEDVVGPLGVVIPKGSVASGEIISPSNNSEKRTAELRIQTLTVNGRQYDVSSEVTNLKLDNIRTGSRVTPVKVIAGAGLGAILGRVIGGNTTSTVIGAAGGAAAGSVFANRTARVDRCVPAGGRINARLTEPLRISMTE